MSVMPAVQATVTNIGQGGRWTVIQTITTQLGPFKTHDEAARVAATVTGTEHASSRGEG